MLGICLGMQLLFDRSDELGETDGLGLIRGERQPAADRAACASRTSAGAMSGSSDHRR